MNSNVAGMGKVAVLMGGWSNERPVSLMSGNGVADALERVRQRLDDPELQRNLTLVARHGERGAAGRIRAMEEAFPDASVTGYEGLMGGLACHPKDRHVVAAAVHSGCQLIVTANLKDFPPTALARHDLQAVSPDSFLLDQLDLYPGQVMTALRQQSSDSGRPRLTPLGLLTSLERCGVPKFVTEIRRKSELSTWAPRTV